jgi:hypothetical protein
VSFTLALGLFFLGTINLESTPRLFWDEGWTLSLARNWVERGHYGRFLAGQPAPPGLEAAISVTGPVALSFYFFGVGVWQGRLVGVLFMLAALGTIYYLTRQLYDQSVAIGTLAVLLLLSMYPQLHPLFMGRTVLAEIPMLFYLLSGYTLFLLSSYKSIWFALLAVMFWGIALVTKLQVLPFWTISLALPLTIMLFKRRWKIAGLLAFGLSGSLLVSKVLPWVEQVLLQGYTLPKTPLHRLYSFTALVPLESNRWDALETTLVVGLPTLLALSYEIWKYIKSPSALSGEMREIVRLALVFLAGSWFAWYLLLSVGWPRYLFPATFVGSIFVAAMLHDWTHHFNLLSTIRHAVVALKPRQIKWHNLRTLLAIILVAWSLSITLKGLYHLYFIFPDTSAQQVAHFLNTQTPTNALIETYESELHFLLNRRYHYPPDQISVDLNLRNLGKNISINYDPLGADSDYLVIGGMGHGSELYRSILDKEFRLLQTYGGYHIYERVR